MVVEDDAVGQHVCCPLTSERAGVPTRVVTPSSESNRNTIVVAGDCGSSCAPSAVAASQFVVKVTKRPSPLTDGVRAPIVLTPLWIPAAAAQLHEVDVTPVIGTPPAPPVVKLNSAASPQYCWSAVSRSFGALSSSSLQSRPWAVTWWRESSSW